jgi:hypothetical protein
MIQILHNLALFWVKKRQFFLNFSAKIFKKIITSVPGAQHATFLWSYKGLNFLTYLGIYLQIILIEK